MAGSSGLGRRIKWTVIIVLVLAIVIGIGEVMRRFFEREELAAIHRVLKQAQKSTDPLIEIDPEWDRLSTSLAARIEAAPHGSLAILSHRAVMQLWNNMRGSISLVDQATATVKYGNISERDMPLTDEPAVWFVEIQGSWNNGPWFEWYRGSWEGEGWSEAEVALDNGLSDEEREKVSAFLKLRATLKLYLGKNAEAALAASDPQEFARAPFIFQERRSLGNHKIWTRGVPTGSPGP